jgi:hypothetical protein
MRTSFTTATLTDLAIQWIGRTFLFDMETCQHCGQLTRIADIQIVNGEFVCQWCQKPA